MVAIAHRDVLDWFAVVEPCGVKCQIGVPLNGGCPTDLRPVRRLLEVAAEPRPPWNGVVDRIALHP